MFKNPLGQENLGSFSIQKPVVDTTGADIVSAAGNIYEALRSKPVSREEINDQQKALGRDLAIQRAKRYDEIVSTNDANVAFSKLQDFYDEDVRGQSIHFSEAYEEVMRERFGSVSFSAWEEGQRRSELERQAVFKSGMIETGTKALAAKGVDTTGVSQESLFKLGVSIAGEAEDVTRQNAKYALEAAKYSVTERERKVKSNATFNNFAANKRNEGKALTLSYLDRMAKEPNSLAVIQSEAITKLREEKDRTITQLQEELAASGGDIQDVLSRVTEIENSFNHFEFVISGSDFNTLAKAQIERYTLGPALDFFSSASAQDNNDTAYLASVNNFVKFQIQDVGEVLKGSKPMNELQTSTIVAATRGAARALGAVGADPQQVTQTYGILADTYSQAFSSNKEKTRRSAAESLFDVLSETVLAKPSLVRTATGANAVPKVFEKLARTDVHPDTGVAIMEAAAAEGTTPRDLWLESSRAITRVQLMPELERIQRDYRDKLTVEWTGSRFKVNVKQDISPSTLAARQGSVGPFGGLGTASRGVDLSSAGRKLEKLFNDMALSYNKVTGEPIDDIGPAMLAGIEVELGLLSMSKEDLLKSAEARTTNQ